jgi:CoA:oxalate CoA-transferase
MLQTVTREDGVSIRTTRSPLRVDGQRARTGRAAPLIGEQSDTIRKEFDL